MVICDQNTTLPSFLNDSIKKDIVLTRLGNYLPFLFQNNLAFMKIDVEGFEEKAIEGGIEIITKYHVPFIFMEFTPSSLQLHGTDPKKFLQMFLDNGYKISTKNFLDKDYDTIDSIITRTRELSNLFIVYKEILK